MKKHLEIVVTVNWYNEFFARTTVEEKRFPLEKAVEGGKYFFEKSADDGIYQHTTIQIVTVRDE